MAIGELYRKELDAIAEHYQLSPAAIAVALDLAGARPKRDEIVQFVVRVVQLAGVLSLAAGVVFFIAANWAAFHVFGRFVLIEALLAASVGIALWKTPPNAVGRYALLMAFILTGVLLALFGQTYQTGADVYELFLTWTVLGLLFAIAAQWSVAWGAWTFALNVAFALFCGWQPQAGWFWVIRGLGSRLSGAPSRASAAESAAMGALRVSIAYTVGAHCTSVAGAIRSRVRLCVRHLGRRRRDIRL
jgi:hypothetical protein